jgi:hypothetical protein
LISLTTQTLQGSTIPNRFLSKILELYSISQIQNPSSLTDLKSSSRPIKSQSHCFNEGKGRRRKRGGGKKIWEESYFGLLLNGRILTCVDRTAGSPSLSSQQRGGPFDKKKILSSFITVLRAPQRHQGSRTLVPLHFLLISDPRRG